MEILRCRTRLAVLWVIKAMGFVAFFFLNFFEPEFLSGLMSGKWNGAEVKDIGLILIFGISFWIPWFMAWAVMTLNLTFNRWVNTILGVILAISLAGGVFGKSSLAIRIDYILGFICYLLIAWYGWKLPKNES